MFYFFYFQWRKMKYWPKTFWLVTPVNKALMQIRSEWTRENMEKDFRQKVKKCECVWERKQNGKNDFAWNTDNKSLGMPDYIRLLTTDKVAFGKMHYEVKKSPFFKIKIIFLPSFHSYAWNAFFYFWKKYL